MKAVVCALGIILGCAGFSTAVWADSSAGGETPQLRWFHQTEGMRGSDTPYGNNVTAGKYVQAGDAKIYYEIYGEGQPLFVFHGGGVGSPYELGRIIDALRSDFKIVVVSTRGHGRSEIGHTPLSYEQKAEDMLTVMRAVTDKAAPVLGFSDGAYTAYKLAAMYPEAVERIVAIGAGTLKAGYFPPEMKIADLEKIDRAYVAQLRRLMPEPERLQEFLNAYMTFWNGMEIGKELFSSIQCPVLLVTGDEDDHAPIASVLEAHQFLPNSRFCVVPKAWHTAFLDNYPVTWAAIDQFIHADLCSLSSSKKLQ